MSIIDNNPDNAAQVLNDLTENVDSLAEDKGIVPEGKTKPGGIKRFFHWIQVILLVTPVNQFTL